MPEDEKDLRKYRIPITLLLDTCATQKALAVENAGQIRELLPVKMESVLTQYEVTRHEITAHYSKMEQISPFLEESEGERRTWARAIFRIPMDVLMETTAADSEEALKKAECVLGAVAERMGESFDKFRVVNVVPRIHVDRIAPVN